MLTVLLAAAGLAQFAHGRPPTLDPTYGFPVPPISTARPAGPPDALWIWATETRDQQTIYLAKDLLFATGRPPITHLFITADNYFTVFVNGVKVGETNGEGNGWSQVHDFDTTKLTMGGQARIRIVARNAGGPAGVLVRLAAGNYPLVLTDSSWRVSEQLPSGNWLTEPPSGPNWQPATVLGPAGMDPWGSQLRGWPVELNAVPGYLKHFAIQPVAWAYADKGLDHLTWRRDFSGPIDGFTERVFRPEGGVPPGVMPRDLPWRIIFDFGKEISGRVQVETNVAGMTFNSMEMKSIDAAPTVVGTGESAGEALEKPYTSVQIKRSDTGLISSPYSAFRFVAVTFQPLNTGAPHTSFPVSVRIHLDHLYYPVKYSGSFDCSDPLLTKIWYTGAYTAHLCMQQDIWDAPKRDRARWMGDLHVSGEVINDVFLDRFLMEQTMRRLREDAQGGAPPDKLPNSHVNGIPGYSCAWIAGLADFYRHTGDLDYLKSQHKALVSILEFMRGEIGPDGIFANNRKQWPFVDWAPEFNKDTPSARAATHLFYLKAVREAVFLLRALGDNGAAQVNQGWADLLELAAQEKLVGAKGTFGDRRQENAMAIYSGAASPKQRANIFAKIFRANSPAWKWQATPYYDNYVIYAMSMAGHTHEALDFVRKYWGGMLAEGATSFWEGYDTSWDKHDAHIHLQADDGAGYFVSLCHGWSAGATSWLTDRVLGVRSTGAGFETCEIQPELADLNWVEGTVPTPHGPIHVRVDRLDTHLRAKISVPPGVVAKVTLPGRASVTVRGNLVLRT